MNTSECNIYLPAFLDNQFSCTFQTVKSYFSELGNNFWIDGACILTSSKFCYPHSKIHSFLNTGKQSDKFTTLIINLCLGLDINAGLCVSVPCLDVVSWVTCNIAWGSAEGVSFWSPATSCMVTHVPLCAGLSLKYVLFFIMNDFHFLSSIFHLVSWN